jgi:SsrA-binding protein
LNKKKAQPTAPNTKPKNKEGKAAEAKSVAAPTHKMVTENRKARFQYEILDSVECGIVLHGSEVKSLRNGRCSIEEAYARLQSGEMWLVGCEIDEYRQASIWNHPTKRNRKLLLHRRELHKFAGRAKERGLTMVPLRVYFTDRGVAKCVIAICKGKKMHDKRETLKKADANREMSRAMKTRKIDGGR